MELDVTRYFDMDCAAFSSSVLASGLSDIGQVTWRNAVAEAESNPLCDESQQDELRSWIRDFGAWEESEIDAMSDVETCALLLQFVADDMQTFQDDESAETRLYRADNGQIYFYAGN
jgi:hypothetical protein